MDGEHETLSKLINKKTSEVFSLYQNLDSPMDWNTAKHRAVGMLIGYITETFLDVPPSDYGEYADLREEPEVTGDIDGDFNFGGSFMDVDPGDQVPEDVEEQEQDPEMYNEMKFSDFLRTFDFYSENNKTQTTDKQLQPQSNEQIQD